jgi:hypothetical protein
MARALLAIFIAASACGGNAQNDGKNSGGASGAAMGGSSSAAKGGSAESGGVTGGAVTSGGRAESGGAVSSGGASGAAGAPETGGAAGSGGESTTGGAPGTGGAPATCQEMARTAQAAFSALVLASRACEQASDCGLARPVGNCIWTCPVVASTASFTALEAAGPELCKPFDAAQCQPVIVSCPPPPPALECSSGTCKAP